MEPDERASRRAPQATADPLVGRLLEGRYRLHRRIARGGMAGVYEAVDTRLDRTVAIKVMHAGMGDDDAFAARFVREARAAAQLSHPHVVSVYDQGDDDGTLYLAMEYVPGHTLRDVIRSEAPLSPARALALVEPVLAALATAHRAGLVHRDIKPENVLIGDRSPGSRIKVADFGLAKAVSADTQHTATGVLIGTVSYLAPELVVQGQADPRADVYATGVVLYELLTGHKPHEGESPIQVAYKHVHEDVPAPSARVPSIPTYVDALVARATARDRGQRPADASVLLHQVHRVAQALRDGVTEDPELESTCARCAVVAPLDVEVEADRQGFVDLVDEDEVNRRGRSRRRPDGAGRGRRHATVPAVAAPPHVVDHGRRPSVTSPRRSPGAQPPGRRARRRLVGPDQALRRDPCCWCSPCCWWPGSAAAPGGSATPAGPAPPGRWG